MLAFLWIVGSWILTIGVGLPVNPSSVTYRYGVQLMMIGLATGIMVGWPLLRLSQRPLARPRRQTLLDLAVLVATLQIVLWPLRLITTWSLERTAAIDALIAAWAALAAAAIAAAAGSARRGPRTLAMLACVAMCLLAPAAALLRADAPDLATDTMSPLAAAYAMAAEGAAPVGAAAWRRITVVGAAAAAAWAALAATARTRRANG
jgi:hypothetical protein